MCQVLRPLLPGLVLFRPRLFQRVLWSGALSKAVSLFPEMQQEKPPFLEKLLSPESRSSISNGGNTPTLAQSLHQTRTHDMERGAHVQCDFRVCFSQGAGLTSVSVGIAKAAAWG